MKKMLMLAAVVCAVCMVSCKSAEEKAAEQIAEAGAQAATQVANAGAAAANQIANSAW